MAKYIVTNPDAPIESDYWIDVPIRDPETNMDQVDALGRIMVERHVTRSVNKEGYNAILNKLPVIDTLQENLTNLDTYAKDSISILTENVDTNTTNLENVTSTLNDQDVKINALYTKINNIQGIDIDDLKFTTETAIKELRESKYSVEGGVLKGDVSIQTQDTATLTLAPTGSSSFASFATNNDVLNCTTTWGKLFKISDEGAFFYGLADKAETDKLGQELSSTYVKSVTGVNNTLNVVKGDGTSSLITVDKVATAMRAEADKNGVSFTDNYLRKDINQNVEGILSFTKGFNLNNCLVTIKNNPADGVIEINPKEEGSIISDGVNADVEGNVNTTQRALDFSAKVDITSNLKSVNSSYTLPCDALIQAFCANAQLVFLYSEPNCELPSFDKALIYLQGQSISGKNIDVSDNITLTKGTTIYVSSGKNNSGSIFLIPFK